MRYELTIEQQQLFKEFKLIQSGQNYYNRKNFVLLGKAGLGKTVLLKRLAQEEGFEYINFTQEHLEDFLQSDYISFKYLTSNEFFKYLNKKYSMKSDFYLIDSLEPILLAIYENGGKRMLLNFFNSFFIQKPMGYFLLAINDLEYVDFNKIISESKFSQDNVFSLTKESLLKEKLANKYQLPQVKVQDFQNNHYFKAYQGGDIR
ncbi:ATP-binding protein [Orenia marismortui]|uniref:AAA domain-containing protein n=1 Tax=Orenia marismortui TaxID=46469 RepID=A0A4R8H158_9FIRM|nr:ATP-binding protein [Orenia marismortui]TDX53237.1 hypothetical protein C7959_10389 [Orenia marismortui]